MTIPKHIRVCLNAPEKQSSHWSLASFTKHVNHAHRQRESLTSRETAGHMEAPLLPAMNRKLETLLTIGINDTVNFISSIASTHGESASTAKLLEMNVTTLAESTEAVSHIRLSPKEVRILSNRIESILDLLSLHDAVILTYALSRLDRRLHSTAKRLFEQITRLCQDINGEGNTSPNIVESLVLVLTSLEILTRAQPESNVISNKSNSSSYLDVKSIKAGSSTVASKSLLFQGTASAAQAKDIDATSIRSSITIPERNMYATILDAKVTECMQHGSRIELSLLLLLVQAMANMSLPVAIATERFIRMVRIEDLNEKQLCEYLHSSSKAMNMHQIPIQDVIEKCTLKISEAAKCDLTPFEGESVSQVFHSFYLTGNMDQAMLATLANHIASNETQFSTSRSFYRTAVPLVITGQLSSDHLCKWMLNQMAQNVDLLINEASQFLFVLTGIANHIKVVWKKREKLPLSTVSVETDIYERAETYLRQQEGEKTYFSSPRATMLFLLEKANSMIKTSTSEEFVQILLLNCSKNFKPDSRIKFELLKECKKRIKEISIQGIPQVLQTLFLLFSPNSPELVEVFTLYLDRINVEIGVYNQGEAQLVYGNDMLPFTFLEDVNLLGNVLAMLDRYNLNRGDLSEKVIELLELKNYKLLETATFQALVDLLHYLSFSLDRHEAIDVIAIIMQQKLANGAEASDGQLAAVAECFIAAPMALNQHRHHGLLKYIQDRANQSKDSKSILKDLLKRLS